LNLAAWHVGHANSVFGEIVRSTDRAVSVCVDVALRVSKLAFAESVEEVQSITVHAKTSFVELGTVLIAVCATAVGIHEVPFHASKTAGSVRVVVLAVSILHGAEMLSGQSIAILAGQTVPIGGIFRTPSNLTCLRLAQTERILTFIAPILIKSQTSTDRASP
jgi:hypothetical protein